MTGKYVLVHRTLDLYLKTPTEFVEGICYLTDKLEEAYVFDEVPKGLQMLYAKEINGA